MDAKPQRPLRSLRARNDENAPLDTFMGKTIHQRNKSSPALSMAAMGAIKPGAKRSAFGDVSNLVGPVRSSKDDSALSGKPVLQPSAKLMQPLQEKKPASFAKPAQRPMSVTNLKNLFTGGNTSTVVDDGPKLPSTELTVLPAASYSRKVLTKRNTTIFRDTALDTVQEADPPKPLEKTTSSQQAEATETEQGAQHVLPPPELQNAPVEEPVKEISHPKSDASLPSIESVSLEPLNKPIQAPTMISVHPLPDPTKNSIPTFVPTIAYQHAPTGMPISTYSADNALPTTSGMTKLPALPPALPPLDLHHAYQPARPEPEEYWDEEEEDLLEEEGYVTARSFRSKGENTTGSATTVVFPQITQRARKEISAANQYVEASRTPDEIEDERYDTSMVAEYGDEIFQYMKEMEVKMLPNAHYMDNQHEIQWSMRSVLMDWLVQVHHRFNLLPETLFLCVNYIDRFLSCKVVSLGKLQLVGATAIFIAAKYEEINCPSIAEIVYMVDNGYSIDEVLKAERFMLTMLQFELGWPGPMSFLRRISKADDYDLETRTLAKYFLEVTIMDERFIGSPPSFAAAASHCLARLMLRKGVWTQHHVHYSGYTFLQLRPLLNLLLECCEDPRKHHAAVYNKYCDKRYKRASAFVETEIGRGFTLQEPVIVKQYAPFPVQPFYDTVPYFTA